MKNKGLHNDVQIQRQQPPEKNAVTMALNARQTPRSIVLPPLCMSDPVSAGLYAALHGDLQEDSLPAGPLAAASPRAVSRSSAPAAS